MTPRSKVKVARSRDQSELSFPDAVPVSLEAAGGKPCWPNPAATLLVYLCCHQRSVALMGLLGESSSSVRYYLNCLFCQVKYDFDETWYK